MNGLSVCTGCGCTPGEFRARGLLGCPDCYEHLRDALEAELLQLHPLLYREPATAFAASPEDAGEGIAALREQLGDALRGERYEDAARLRAELARRTATPPGPGT